jgi:hypothetical protein
MDARVLKSLRRYACAHKCRQNLCPEAIAVYTEAANAASKLQGADGRALHAVILANRALCFLKTQQYDHCITVTKPGCADRFRSSLWVDTHGCLLLAFGG